MAEAVKNGLPIPQITFFLCKIVFSSIPPLEIVSLIQALPPPSHSSLPQSTTSKFHSSTSNFV